MRQTRHLDQARRDSFNAGLRAAERETSKADLKAMLADAVRNTAALAAAEQPAARDTA